MNDQLAAVIVTRDDPFATLATRSALLHSGIKRIFITTEDRCFQTVPEYLVTQDVPWVFHLRAGDLLTDDFAELFSSALQEVNNGDGSFTSCIMNLPVNFDSTVDGYRRTGMLFQQLMTWGGPSLNICTGVFERLFVQQMWEWSARRNLPYTYNGNAFNAFEFLMWISIYTRLGYVYGLKKPLSIPAYPDFADGDVLDDVRNLYIRKWLGFRIY